jgi:hypothetical protein
MNFDESMEEFGFMWLQKAESIYKVELLGMLDMMVLRLDLDKTW